jgi:hypothetical protein
MIGNLVTEYHAIIAYIFYFVNSNMQADIISF